MPVRTVATDPKEWRLTAARVRARDGNRCKFCGVDNGAKGYRDAAGAFVRTASIQALEEAGVLGRKIIKIVLKCVPVRRGAGAALREDDLASLCQQCLCRHDRAQRQANAARTRASRRASADLFGDHA